MPARARSPFPTVDGIAPTRRQLLAWLAATGVLASAACSRGDGAAAPATQNTSPSSPRGPQPVKAGSLSMVASQQGEKLLLHTKGGDLDFWAGVNLGSSIPGHMPGEVAMSTEDFRRWFPMMRDLGVRVLRIYTILPPAFYTEFHSYNRAHADDPLYLIQGIYLPDETYIDTGDLYAAGTTQAMIEEIRDASAAVHGTLHRSAQRGRASGQWTVDVSPWVAAWLVGVEWDPAGTKKNDATHAGRPPFQGTYFAATAQATPTETWIAARLDELATLEAKAGCCVPIGIVNWPTGDPLSHPDEPSMTEDIISVDANHVLPTKAWPAGTFASYHAYPYYPDFQMIQYAGPDPYRDYLLDLKRHYAGMPLMITELGVPGSLGCAHIGSNGRNQGGHDEVEQMRMDAELVRGVHDIGLAGAILFAWADEWFKFTWNTQPRQAAVDAERRALWHDALTNEQWFGLLATDPAPAGRRVIHESRHGIRTVAIDHDASWVYLTLEYAGDLRRVELGFDVLGGGGLKLPSGAGDGHDDVAIVIEPGAGTATAYVRADVDPLLLDNLKPETLPKPLDNGWTLQRLALNRSYVVKKTGQVKPLEVMEVGRLRYGPWEVDADGVDSRNTWRLEEKKDGKPAALKLRLPWGMLLMADPSSHTAYRAREGKPEAVTVNSLNVTVVADGIDGQDDPFRFPITWDEWNAARYRERPKRGIDAVRQELRRHQG